MLCQRCYIKKHKLKKNEIKKLIVTSDKFQCAECGEYKKLVIERNPREEWYDDENSGG